MGKGVLARVDSDFYTFVRNNRYKLSAPQYTNLLYQSLMKQEPNIELIRAKAKRKPRLVVPREAAEFRIDFGL